MQKAQSSELMPRLLKKLAGLSVDGYSCRQDMEDEFDQVFGDASTGGNMLFPGIRQHSLKGLAGSDGRAHNCNVVVINLSCTDPDVCGLYSSSQAVVSLHADEQMEMATNNILAGYCWAKRWPYVADMLEVIDDPHSYGDTGNCVKTSRPATMPVYACHMEFCLFCASVQHYLSS